MHGDLVAVVGRENVLTGPDAIAPYCVDWSGRFRGTAPVVVRPGTTAEVAAVVQVCREKGVALVPQGGNTGLVGGGVPLHGEAVLSLRRLAAVDVGDGCLTAGAGVPLAAVHAAAATAGWAYGVDFASRERATVGGSIATNAGGLRVLRHGDTRAQVLGIEAVLGDGTVVSRLGGLRRDNTGYHLPSLLCGSEGTLGVITAATLRLVPRADRRATALVAFPDVDAAVAAALVLRRQVRALEAVELFLADGLALVCTTMGLRPPFVTPYAAYFVVEAADQTGNPEPELRAAVDSLVSVADALMTADAEHRRELWRYREQHSAAVNTLGPPHKLDVTVPLVQLAAFLGMVPAVVSRIAPGAHTWLWGHAADGNVHVNVTGLAPDDERVDDAVLQLTVDMGGSISAEHGIGTAKRGWLARSRSLTEVDAFRALKRALDPDGILNPNVLLPPAIAVPEPQAE